MRVCQLCPAVQESKGSTSRSTSEQQLHYCPNTSSLPPGHGCHKGWVGFAGAVCFGFGRIQFVLEVCWFLFFFGRPTFGAMPQIPSMWEPAAPFLFRRAPSLWEQHDVSWSFQMKLGKWAAWLASAIRCTKRHCGGSAFARKSNKCNFLHELAVPHWLQKGSEGEQEKIHCLLKICQA